MTKFYIYRNDQVEGPFQPDHIARLDSFSPDFLVCREETDAWLKASEMPEFAAYMMASVAPPDPAHEQAKPLAQRRGRLALILVAGAAVLVTAALLYSYRCALPSTPVDQHDRTDSLPRSDSGSIIADSRALVTPVAVDTTPLPPPTPVFGLGIYLTPAKAHLAAAVWSRLAAMGVKCAMRPIGPRDLIDTVRLSPSARQEILQIRGAKIQVVASLEPSLWRNREPATLFRDTSLVDAVVLAGACPEDSPSILRWSAAVSVLGVEMVDSDFVRQSSTWWSTARAAAFYRVRIPSADSLPAPIPGRFSEGQTEALDARGRRKITVAFTLESLTNRLLIEACQYDAAEKQIPLGARAASWCYENDPTHRHRIPDFVTPPGAWFLNAAQLDPTQTGKNIQVEFTPDPVAPGNQVFGQITEEVWDEANFGNAWQGAMSASRADKDCAIIVQMPPRLPGFLTLTWFAYLKSWAGSGIFFPSDQTELLMQAAMIDL